MRLPPLPQAQHQLKIECSDNTLHSEAERERPQVIIHRALTRWNTHCSDGRASRWRDTRTSATSASWVVDLQAFFYGIENIWAMAENYQDDLCWPSRYVHRHKTETAGKRSRRWGDHRSPITKWLMNFTNSVALNDVYVVSLGLIVKYKEFRVCVIEKAAEVGGHILSGACLEPRYFAILQWFQWVEF